MGKINKTKKEGKYFCRILQADMNGEEEQICSICSKLLRDMQREENLRRAFRFAREKHRGQFRKGSRIPYLIHLIRTWGYVRQMNDCESVQMAALLHDVLEDTEATYEELEREFSPEIAGLVAGESEEKREGIPAGETWKIRKQETLERLKSLEKEAGRAENLASMQIAFADKLANLYSMAYEYRLVGDRIWEKFNQKDKNMHRWYYGSMGEIFSRFFGEREPELWRDYRNYYEEVFGENEVPM